MNRWLFLLAGLVIGGAGAIVVAGGGVPSSITELTDQRDTIESIDTDGNGVAVTLPEEHSADKVAIRHEYAESFSDRILLGGDQVEAAPQFGGTVQFGTGRGSFGSGVFCSQDYPTSNFVIVAVDEQAVDGGGLTWEILDKETVSVDLSSLNC